MRKKKTTIRRVFIYFNISFCFFDRCINTYLRKQKPSVFSARTCRLGKLLFQAFLLSILIVWIRYGREKRRRIR